MCGIVGIVNKKRLPVRASEVETMLQTVLPRGPDHHGVRTYDHIGFGHARLSILDVSARGNQPFTTPDGQGVLIYNGEVYNFHELRNELEQQGITFISTTDTEVVLQALHTWGVKQAIPRFNGMFAFAYADLRNDTLWLARDRLGIKPLFIAETQDKLIFASEQKALLAHPQVCTAIDIQSTLSLLLYERFSDTETPYQSTRNFPAGSIMKISNAGVECSTYFDVRRDIDVTAIADNSRSFSDTCHVFERALVDSVKQHMISDAPLATLCSGGLDSGLVTAIAAQQNPKLISYVADLEGMQGEEYRRASLIAEHVDTRLRRVPVSQDEFLRALPEAIAANDQPLFFAQKVALFLVARQMRADGFKVVLTGDGADELFGGYTWYADEYDRWARRSWRARWVPDIPAMRKLGRFIPGLRPTPLERELANYALTSQPIEYVATSFNTAAVGGMTRTLRQRALFERLQSLPLPARAFLTRNFEDIYVHMRESLNTSDKMTMHFGIEGRVPFMENTLIELGMNLPVTHKYYRGTRKALINRMAQRWLPAGILNLPKIGFTAPPALWGNTLSFLQDGHVARLLKWPRAQHEDIVALLNPRAHYGFRLLCCEIWMKLHLDNIGHEEVAERLLLCAHSESGKS